MRCMIAVREEDREGGALPVLTRDIYLTAMQKNQLVDDGQTQPRAPGGAGP